jgi:hypothetical protein
MDFLTVIVSVLSGLATYEVEAQAAGSRLTSDLQACSDIP